MSITVMMGKLIESNFDLGLKNYPIYKEEYRERLNNKIIEHFYFREIGLETPELFKRFLNRKLNEIMPYYNQLYKSEDLEYNPLYNIELKESFEHTTKQNGNIDTKGTQTGENTNNSIMTDNTNNVNVESDTPQSNISLEQIKNNPYASKTNFYNSAGDSVKNDKINTNEENTLNTKSENEIIDSYTKKTEGSSAGLSFSKAVAQWREVMLNIDMLVVEELEPLFLQIWEG